jgi:hypothetical protein
VQVSPARAALLLAGTVGLALNVAGFLLALVFVDRRIAAFGLSFVNTVVSAAVSIVIGRRALGRIAQRLPDRAVVVPARLVSVPFVGSVVTALAVVGLSILGVVPAAALGAGAGAELGRLWSAWQMGELERNAGRHVLRPTRRRRGEPVLYAVPAA